MASKSKKKGKKMKKNSTISFTEAPKGKLPGNDYGHEVGIDVQEIPFDYCIEKVEVVVKWGRNHHDSSNFPILKLKRGKLKRRQISGECLLAKWNHKKKDSIQKVTIKIKPDSEHAFWGNGDEGDSLGLYYDAGDKDSTVEFIELNVKVSVRNAGYSDVLHFNKRPKNNPICSTGFSASTGIQKKKTKFEFEFFRVHGYVQWKEYLEKDSDDDSDSDSEDDSEDAAEDPNNRVPHLLELKRAGNDSSLKLAKFDLSQRDKSYKQEFDIEPDSDNSFWETGSKGEAVTLYCTYNGEAAGVNIEFEEVDVKLHARPPPVHAAAGNVRAFIVGIADYTVLHELKSAVVDSRAVRDLLIKAGLKLFTGFRKLTNSEHLREWKEHRREGKDPDMEKHMDANIFYIEDCHIFNLQKMYQHFLTSVQEGDIAFVFFAGHGCQFKNEQRLLARGLTTGQRTDFETGLQSIAASSLRIQGMITELDQKKARTKVVLLDCCREFAYKDDVMRAGLETYTGKDQKGFNVQVAEGTMIGFATAPNEKAYEPAFSLEDEAEEEEEEGKEAGPAAAAAAATVSGAAKIPPKKKSTKKKPDPKYKEPKDYSGVKHGYYTEALLNHLTTPNTDLDTILRRVGHEVEMKTSGTQRPYRNSCINAEKHFLFAN